MKQETNIKLSASEKRKISTFSNHKKKPHKEPEKKKQDIGIDDFVIIKTDKNHHTFYCTHMHPITVSRHIKCTTAYNNILKPHIFLTALLK